MLDLGNKIENKKILIYGFGKTGISCFNYLKKNNYLNIYDDNKKSLPKKIKNFLVKKQKINSYNFDLIILSPGINLNKCDLKKYLKKNKYKIINDLDIFYFHNQKNKIITITGTNGKSTTSKLLYDILKKHNKDVRLVGNIGNPILAEKNIKNSTIFVIEASSYQIAYSNHFKTDFAIVLNISPDHLERHKTLKNYTKTKLKLIKNRKIMGYGLIEKKNKYLNKEIKKFKSLDRIIKVNANIPNKIRKLITNPYFDNQNNINNLAFILAIAKKIKLNNDKIIKVVNNFKSLKYRQEIIYKNKNLLVINDSKSTSLSSSINLLKTYKNIYWILGGISKKGDQFKLNKKYYRNINAYIYGKSKFFFKNIFRNKIKFFMFKNITKALEKIIVDIDQDSKFNKNVIFSPSAASFDQFKNFEDRGRYFNRELKRINFIKRINDR